MSETGFTHIHRQEFGIKQNLETSWLISLAWIAMNGGQQKDDEKLKTEMGIIVRSSVEVLNLNTKEAILDEYIEFAKEVLKKVPTDRLDASIKATQGMPYNEKNRTISNDATRAYLNPHRYKMPLDAKIPSSNPFNLGIPPALTSLQSWLNEQGKDTAYASSERATRLEADKLDTNYIKIMHAWNAYHVGFLEILNVVDPQERQSLLSRHHKAIFGAKIGYGSGPTITELSSYDTPEQWLVYNALNILLSSEPRISPLARTRAIELLSSLPAEELSDAAIGKGNRTPHGQRKNPLTGMESYFQNRYMRVPKRFWVSAQEKTHDLHPQWQTNETIQQIIGAPTGNTYDYGRIFNTLVASYPAESIQVTLLMLLGGKIHQGAALQALATFPRLDILKRQEVFGERASYIQLLSLPIGSEERISEGLGIQAFDPLLDIDIEGLSKDEIEQILRRSQQTILNLQNELVEKERENVIKYFAESQYETTEAIDPLGYYRLLGVHPMTDTRHIGEILKRSYRYLATQYHPDLNKGIGADAEIIKRINIAYEVLSDSTKRGLYGKRS